MGTRRAKAGVIPPRIIFYMENPVPLRSWGWAPLSLLGSPTADSAFDFPQTAAWLTPVLAQSIPNGGSTGLGIPRDTGLRVRFQACASS